MRTLRSYVCGEWREAAGGFAGLVDPSTEEEIARASTDGIDFAAVLAHARERGGPALRAMTFAERAAALKTISKVLREGRDELLELSRVNNGATRRDGSFDVDGASGTLAYYAYLGGELGERRTLVEGEGVRLGRSDSFWGLHLLAPRVGVAVHVNAFNFPAWGFAEKAACALLAGMPVITKPATATALVAERCVEMAIEARALPEGALQLLCGSTGDLLGRLGPQDVLAFTGSADTARALRSAGLAEPGPRFNVEADSLNAAVLAPGVDLSGATGGLFLTDVTREITQKSGQKCTAVRRILVPREQLPGVEAALAERLSSVVVGNPAVKEVSMGPLATAAQLADAESGVEELAVAAERILGTGRRVDGVGSPPGKGFFFAPTLLRAAGDRRAEALHRREVFAPVAVVVPYDGSPGEAAELVALGGGTLVTSVYGDDTDWLGRFTAEVAPTTGRLYVGSEEAAGEAPGSGVALPQTLHGGPGRAGGGEELGGLLGVKLYMQRLAVQGGRPVVESLSA